MKMKILPGVLLCGLVGTVVNAATHDISVGKGASLAFQPNTLTAEVGDVYVSSLPICSFSLSFPFLSSLPLSLPILSSLFQHYLLSIGIGIPINIKTESPSIFITAPEPTA